MLKPSSILFALILSTAASPAFAAAGNSPTRIVSYADLDLSRAAGRRCRTETLQRAYADLRGASASVSPNESGAP